MVKLYRFNNDIIDSYYEKLTCSNSIKCSVKEYLTIEKILKLMDKFIENGMHLKNITKKIMSCKNLSDREYKILQKITGNVNNFFD